MQQTHQVSRDRINPPLVVRPIEITEPDQAGSGCVLVLVDASSEAPHMVDDRYWGRGATGKRPLTDSDVRKILDLNARNRLSASDQLTNFVEDNPLNSSGCIYVLATPRSGRPGSLADLLDDQPRIYELLQETVGADSDPDGWWLTDERIHRTVDGIDLCHGEVTQFIDRPADQTGLTVRLLRLSDSGRVALTANLLIVDSSEGTARKLLSIEGVSVLTQATFSLAGKLADLAAYAGQWDLGLALTDVRGAQGARRNQRTYGSRRSYPDDQYQRVHQANNADLAERAVEAADVLLRPLLRVIS